MSKKIRWSIGFECENIYLGVVWSEFPELFSGPWLPYSPGPMDLNHFHGHGNISYGHLFGKVGWVRGCGLGQGMEAKGLKFKLSDNGIIPTVKNCFSFILLGI